MVNLKILTVNLAQQSIDRQVHEQTFSDSIGGIVFYVEQVDSATGQWHNVYVHDGRNKDKPVILTARTGWAEADYVNFSLILHLADGKMDLLNESMSRNIRFQTFSMSIPLSLPDRTSMQNYNPSEMTLKELLQSAGEAGHFSNRGRELMIEYHQRFILAVGCFILTVLGLALAGGSSMGHRRSALPAGLFLYFLYYLLFNATETLAENAQTAIWLVLWIPNILFAILTAVGIARMGKESRMSPIALGKAILSRCRMLLMSGEKKP